jgi:hypothetical protein
MIAQSVAEIVNHHVRLTVEGIDRMYLNVYVPGLQYEQGIVRFFREHRGQPLPSAALMSPMTRGFVAALEDFVARHEIPLVQFEKGQRKDTVMAEHLRRFAREEGVVFVGKAQENTPVFRTERRRSPKTGRPYPWIVRRSAMVNNYYIYAVDRDFGPFFLKFCSYFPFNAKLCLNGHEYAKRQLAQEGIAFEALDNGILKCADPERLQTICNGLSAAKIDGLLRKWLRLLPHPFTGADRKAGYRYDISILQAEFSTTQVLDRPVHGRLFFEQVIRENLDLGRPEEIKLIFNRRIPRRRRHVLRQAQERFCTRVVTHGVTPSLHVYYKNARIKQYHKENRALRTETTINNTYDFGIGKRLHNLPKLREIGFAANRRLLEVERLSHDCILSEDAFQAINRPSASGLQACALPINACTRSCTPSSCSGNSRKASGRPICASISPPCRASMRRQSLKAPSPTNCADCTCTASSSAYPKASATRSPTSASASPCSSHEPTIASCAPASPPCSQHYAPSRPRCTAPSMHSRSKSTQPSRKQDLPHKLDTFTPRGVR